MFLLAQPELLLANASKRVDLSRPDVLLLMLVKIYLMQIKPVLQFYFKLDIHAGYENVIPFQLGR
jgi:hypothetical protein